MLYLSHNFSSRSIPTVAPKMPRDTSVRSGIWPSSVLILLFDQSNIRIERKWLVIPSTDRVHIDPISYKHALSHDVDLPRFSKNWNYLP